MAEISIHPNVVNTAGPTAPTGSADYDPGIDASDLLLQMELKRYQVMQGGMLERAKMMQNNNAWLSQLDDTLSKVDAQADPNPSNDSTAELTLDPKMYALFQSSKIGSSTDITNPDGSHTVDTSAQKLAAFLKDQIQACSNSSQLDMIQLQSQVNNLNQTMETATGLMQKTADTKDKIIQNIH